MASTAAQDPVEDLLRDIESHTAVLQQYIHEDTIWDGTAVYPERTKVSVEDGAVRAPASTPTPSCRRRGLAAAGVLVHGEHAPAGVLVHWEFAQHIGDSTCGWLSWFFWKEGDDLWVGACLFLILNAITKAWNAPTGTFSERLDKTRKGLLLGWG
ncbi:hypothetical protein EHS25_001397 [Saitozyma podzolica]|uniref:Uncharacterized protein n=1 Tax=Saitozyma podzolica TaxID=1890683 RepID=A0A427YGJ1_9TREE|nr:hypothetical protein EHS25_001397 [Saitozyma podzolica]